MVEALSREKAFLQPSPFFLSFFFFFFSGRLVVQPQVGRKEGY